MPEAIEFSAPSGFDRVGAGRLDDDRRAVDDVAGRQDPRDRRAARDARPLRSTLRTSSKGFKPPPPIALTSACQRVDLDDGVGWPIASRERASTIELSLGHGEAEPGFVGVVEGLPHGCRVGEVDQQRLMGALIAEMDLGERFDLAGIDTLLQQLGHSIFS